MAYKYTKYEAFSMSNTQLLEAIKAREIAPRWVVGTGYKDARKVAIEYLQEEIEKEEAGK